MSEISILLTALEPSADGLGAGLMVALRARLGPQTRFIGVGGPAMTAAGLVSAFDPADLALVGVFNAAAAYPLVRRRVRQTAELARDEAPDIAVLIDSWGFSIRLARALRRLAPGLTIVKYVAPQVWATRAGRARVLARAVDELLTINAFDAPLFERHGLRTRFVGPPSLAGKAGEADPAAFRARLGIGAQEPLLLVLPGSRVGEVRRLMAPFGAAAARVQRGHPGLRVVIAAAETVDDEVRRLAAAWSAAPIIRPASERFEAMAAATLALACSGTVTSELALASCPMVVGYRLDPLTYLVAKALLRTPYITLFNAMAGRFVAPEHVQGRCTGRSLARDLLLLLDDPDRRAAQARAQTKALDALRGGVDDPLGAAAEAIVETLERLGRVQPRDSSGG
jgi:lipid-A-disaccharide synthase